MNPADDLTVCICTRDRPRSLEQAIRSVQRNAPGCDVVVSDDGSDESSREVAARFEFCRWQRGPADGLGANRNAAIAAVERPWLLFLDDDAEIGPGFAEQIARHLAAVDREARETMIVTGLERKSGRLVAPNDVDFLGFQRRSYRPGEPLHTVVINAAVWPRRLFDRIRFDPRLRYGSDEVDISYAATSLGYRIELCPEAVNLHYPDPSGRSGYGLNAQASRLRATSKRYWVLQGKRGKALVFFCLAPIHLLLAAVKSEGPAGLPTTGRALLRWLR